MFDPIVATSGFTLPSEVYPLLLYIASPRSLSRLATVTGSWASPGLSIVSVSYTHLTLPTIDRV